MRRRLRSQSVDAGAGLKPYAPLFAHCAYESCDFAECDDFFGNLDDGQRYAIRDRHDYICPLDNIPVASATFDFVLCTQVLEHVPDPVVVLKELHRVLSPSGQIFVTVPQGYGIHGEPYNFFNFTKFGLELVLKKAGFQATAIQERGGYFSYLFDRLGYAVPRIVAGYGRCASWPCFSSHHCTCCWPTFWRRHSWSWNRSTGSNASRWDMLPLPERPRVLTDGRPRANAEQAVRSRARHGASTTPTPACLGVNRGKRTNVQFLSFR